MARHGTHCRSRIGEASGAGGWPDRKVIDTAAKNADYRRPMSWMNLLDSRATTASSPDARRHYQKPALARHFRRWCSPLGNLSADSDNNHNLAF